MKDILDEEGIDIPLASPQTVIRAAFMAALIDRGAEWMDALDARNKMAHVYSMEAFQQVAAQVQSRYLSLFEGLHDTLLHRIARQL